MDGARNLLRVRRHIKISCKTLLKAGMTTPLIDKFCFCPVQKLRPPAGKRVEIPSQQKKKVVWLETFYALFFIKFLMSSRVCMMRAGGEKFLSQWELNGRAVSAALLLFRLQLKSFDSSICFLLIRCWNNYLLN